MVLNPMKKHAACRAFCQEKRLKTCAVSDKNNGCWVAFSWKKKILTPLTWNQD